VLCNDTLVGRNNDEVLRWLDALQTGRACKANWRPNSA
jgi:alkyl hydroperoxide reductase subunit AhpC